MKRILAGHHRARVRVCTSAGRQRAVESSVAELLPHPELVLPHRELVLPHREVVLPVRSTCSRSAPGAGGPSPGAGGDREEDREKTGSTSSGSTSASAPHGAGTELPYGAPAPGGRWRTELGQCGVNAEQMRSWSSVRRTISLPHPPGGGPTYERKGEVTPDRYGPGRRCASNVGPPARPVRRRRAL